MPVPCKRDFGLAIDAATGAKRMQNGAAVEANLRTNQCQYVTDGLMIAIIFGQSCRRRRGPNQSPFANGRKRPFAASRLARCRGNVLVHWTRQAADPLQS